MFWLSLSKEIAQYH